jgi:hypothetical protein
MPNTQPRYLIPPNIFPHPILFTYAFLRIRKVSSVPWILFVDFREKNSFLKKRVHMYVCMYACMHVFMYVCICVCMSVCVCMHVFMSVCLSVCTYVCVYMYVCIYVCPPLYKMIVRITNAVFYNVTARGLFDRPNRFAII